MSLETRATHAVRSLQESVAVAAPVGLGTVVTRRRRRSMAAGLVGALAIAFASLAMASMLADLTEADETATVTTDPVIPDDQLIVLPDTDGKDDTESPGIHQKNAVSDASTPYTMFAGTAEPGTVVVATSAYGSADLVVGESGEFLLKLWFEAPPTGEAIPIVLQVGEQSFDFSFTWLWNPGEIALTAHQTYGGSDAATPYEKFFGTAPPGTVIVATSAYGTADAVAGEHGEWYLKLWFEGQPANEAFPISVTVGEESFDFSFTWYQEAGATFELNVAQEGTSSSSASPYTRFVGTAPVGTHVLATSQYGSADLEVGESGEFSLKVWFSGAPAGVKFPITLKIDGETFGTYYFTSNYTPGPVELDLHQYNTESWDANPWIKFYGTADPGTALVANSPYGSASTTVGESGEVYFKLYFSTLPPAGEPFTVTLKVNGSVYGTYQFTSWFSGETEVTPVVTSGTGPDSYAKVEYWATAGTTIQLTSAYGNSDLITLGESSGGHLKLWFSGLPATSQTITVTIKVNGSTYGTFPFTYTAASSIPVTVQHAYNSCTLDPPYDDLWGTAPAGTLIKIISEYGSSELTVGESGEWAKRQFFSGAPYGTPFTVTVKVNGSVHTTYQFTVNPPT